MAFGIVDLGFFTSAARAVQLFNQSQRTAVPDIREVAVADTVENREAEADKRNVFVTRHAWHRPVSEDSSGIIFKTSLSRRI